MQGTTWENYKNYLCYKCRKYIRKRGHSKHHEKISYGINLKKYACKEHH